MAGQDKLVLVGQVFQVFPGAELPYIGIEVTDSPFARRQTLFFRPPHDDSSCPSTVIVSTIEIDRQRTNRVERGDMCAVKPKPLAAPLVIPDSGWQVFVRPAQAEAAGRIQKVIKPRPPCRPQAQPAREKYTFD